MLYWDLMRKIAILASLFGFLWSVALPSIAFGKDVDEKISENTLWSIEYELPEFLRSLFLRQVNEEDEQDIVVQKLLSGERFLYTRPRGNDEVSFATYANSFEVIPATQEEFELIKDYEEKYFTEDGKYPFEEKSYSGQTYWRTLFEGRTLMHDGEHAFIIPYEPMVNDIIDVLQGRKPSLLQNPRYQKMKNSLPWDGSFVSFFYDIRAAIDRAKTEASSEFSPSPAIYDVLGEIFQSVGFTLLKTSFGYEWKYKTDQSLEALSALSWEFTPGGFFMPSLYKKFPNAPVLFYLESNNWKARLDEWDKRFFDIMKLENPDGDSAQALSTNLFETFRKEYGIDLQPLFQSLQGRIAFAVQDTGERLLNFTTLADVSSNITTAEGFVENFKISLASGFDPEKIPDPSITKSLVRIGGKDFSQFSISLTRFPDYEGPKDFPRVTFTLGITDDNLLLISTDPNIVLHYGQGLQNNNGFISVYQNRDSQVLGITYIGLRNFWNFVDRFIAWRLEYFQDREHALPFSFIRHYYKILEEIYSARDIFIEKNVAHDMLTWTAKIFTDTVPHETFRQWKTRLSSLDTDKDGLSDYRERFIFYTDPYVVDSDGDTRSDGTEIQDATDPHNISLVLRDVPREVWYTEAVSNLYARGSITGYPDGTFRPGNRITRAEFACMAARALDIEFKKITGINEVSNVYGGVNNPYHDIYSENWYFPCVLEAYKRKLIYAQDFDFRPNDPITRAEATAIIIRMDEVLQKKTDNLRWSLPQTYDLPFTDVPEKSWFYFYIKVAYLESLVQGRDNDTFAPLENMNRAEAAKMLRDSLLRRMRLLEDSKESPLDDTFKKLLFDIVTSDF